MTALLLAVAITLSPYRLEAYGVSAIIGQHFYNTLVAAGYCDQVQRIEQAEVIYVCRLKNGNTHDTHRGSQGH